MDEEYGKIPTTLEIREKIDEITSRPEFSTLREEIIREIDKWLDELNLKPVIIQFGEETNIKEKIMEAVKDSYDF